MNKVIVKVTGCYNCPFAKVIGFENKIVHRRCGHPIYTDIVCTVSPEMEVPNPPWCPLRNNKTEVVYDAVVEKEQISQNVFVIPEEKSNG